MDIALNFILTFEEQQDSYIPNVKFSPSVLQNSSLCGCILITEETYKEAEIKIQGMKSAQRWGVL